MICLRVRGGWANRNKECTRAVKKKCDDLFLPWKKSNSFYTLSQIYFFLKVQIPLMPTQYYDFLDPIEKYTSLFETSPNTANYSGCTKSVVLYVFEFIWKNDPKFHKKVADYMYINIKIKPNNGWKLNLVFKKSALNVNPLQDSQRRKQDVSL